MAGFDKEIYFNSVRDEPVQRLDDRSNKSWGKTSSCGSGASGTGSGATIASSPIMLATTFKETGRAMWPVTEYGSQTLPHQQGILSLYRARLRAAHVGRKLPEHVPDRRGGPGRISRSRLSARHRGDRDVTGMKEGTVHRGKTGRLFSDTVDDPVNARKIINGLDCADEIAGYHEDFLQAITEATEG